MSQIFCACEEPAETDVPPADSWRKEEDDSGLGSLREGVGKKRCKETKIYESYFGGELKKELQTNEQAC